MNCESDLKALLEQHTIPAAEALVEHIDHATLRCLACANRCVLSDGASGVCRMRANRGGHLRVPGGYVAGLCADPIEKKPFYHAYPGRDALSFGMLGCNYRCSFCQNWNSSQVLRDPDSFGDIRAIDPASIVAAALRQKAPVIVSTYNEPLITADWAALVFQQAVPAGLVCGFVSNGHATPEVIAFLKPLMRLFKVDLKCFEPARYRELGGNLDTVCGTIASLVAEGFWVEVVTLVVPGFNDSQGQLDGMAKFLAGVSVDIPWHVTAYRPAYRMMRPGPTSAADLERAHAAGKAAGLRYVYVGNIPGSLADLENTRCHACNALLIDRHGFQVAQNRMVGDKCPDCNTAIPGVWEDEPPRQSRGQRFFMA